MSLTAAASLWNYHHNAAVSSRLTSVSTRWVHVSVVPGPGPILPGPFPGGQRGHVHALHGGGTFSPGGGRPVVHLLIVPVAIVTCGHHISEPGQTGGGGAELSHLWVDPPLDGGRAVLRCPSRGPCPH